jgi:hypothetical protein
LLEDPRARKVGFQIPSLNCFALHRLDWFCSVQFGFYPFQSLFSSGISCERLEVFLHQPIENGPLLSANRPFDVDVDALVSNYINLDLLDKAQGLV